MTRRPRPPADEDWPFKGIPKPPGWKDRVVVLSPGGPPTVVNTSPPTPLERARASISGIDPRSAVEFRANTTSRADGTLTQILIKVHDPQEGSAEVDPERGAPSIGRSSHMQVVLDELVRRHAKGPPLPEKVDILWEELHAFAKERLKRLAPSKRRIEEVLRHARQDLLSGRLVKCAKDYQPRRRT